jgi:hypothetical protein
MRYKLFFIVVVISFLASSCSSDMDSIVRKLVPEEAIAVGDSAVDFYLAKDSEGLKSIAGPSFRAEATEDALNNVYAFRGEGEFISKKIIGGKFSSSTATGTRAIISYEIEMSNKYLVIVTTLKKSEAQFLLLGLNVNVMESPYSEAVAFSISNKTPVHYLVLGLTIFVPLFILLTLIACIRKKNMRRKILWCIFILFSFGSVTFNWQTAATSFSILQFQFLGAGFLLTDAWYFTVGFPLGAILWWIRHGRPRHTGAVGEKI